MKKGGRSRGFTIVETMIVLAVTGGLFLFAVVAISGRQNRTEFEQSINEIRSQIQQTINEVVNGYVPDTNNFTCTASSSGPSLTAGGSEQGSNSGCLFLGKVIQFDIAGTDPEQFRIYSVAGLRNNISDKEVTTYAEAMPKVIAPATGSPSVPDASDQKNLLYGLTTQRAFFNTTQNIGAVAFLSSLATYNSGNLASGSQQVNIIPILNSSLNTSATTGAQIINANIATSPLNPSSGVSICFVSGGTNQSGLVTIGGSGRQLSVNLSIKGNKTCA